MATEDPTNSDDQVEGRIGKRIAELEEIQRELAKDIEESAGPEKEKNLLLYQATTDVIMQLRQAQENLEILKQRYQ